MLVAAHKEFPMPDNDELYMPILVGAHKNFKNGIAYQRDDMGVNISEKNPNYNELTGVYWAWKNLANVDAIGLVHYRRYFYSKVGARTLDNVASKSDFESRLQKFDVILPKKRHYYIESNYSHYVHAHNSDPLDRLRKLIKDDYPEYLNDFDKVMRCRSAHMFNMFVMRKNVFMAYSKWLFDVLEHLEATINIDSYSVQEARVYGYLSELLMDVWINKNGVSYTEMRWGQVGKRHIMRKGINLILRKFNIGGRKTHF